MSYDESLRSFTLEADATIGIYTGVPGTRGAAVPNGGKQYYFVDITGVHQAGLPSAAGADAVGVLQNKPQHPGDAATVGFLGISLLVVGTVLAAGDKVSSDVNGAGVKNTGTNTALCRCIIGAAPGELATVLLRMN